MKKHFMYRLSEIRNMKDMFILRMKTNEAESFRRFKNLIEELCISAELLYIKNRKKTLCYEILYLVQTERMQEIKKLIDAEINYEVLELFEFVTW